MGGESGMRRERLIAKHRAFWECGEAGETPLLTVNFRYTPDPEKTAHILKRPESDDLDPETIEAPLLYPLYQEMYEAHMEIGDDYIAPCDLFTGVPWLEAAVGCRIKIPQGKSIWPEPPVLDDSLADLPVTLENRWHRSLFRVMEETARFAVEMGIPLSATHLRGPTDILAARMGTQKFFIALMDSPERVGELALQAAELYRRTAEEELKRLAPWENGYVIRQFGLWSSDHSVWLQEDTSGMMSCDQYESIFLPAFEKMAAFPYGVLHLHIHSIHQAELFAQVPGVKCINIYFDDNRTKVKDKIPILKNLQKMKMPLVIAKDIYDGFTLKEYDEILEMLSPDGLSVHLGAGSIEEANEIIKIARTGP